MGHHVFPCVGLRPNMAKSIGKDVVHYILLNELPLTQASVLVLYSEAWYVRTSLDSSATYSIRLTGPWGNITTTHKVRLDQAIKEPNRPTETCLDHEKP